MQTHATTNDYKCPHCPKAFKSSHRLRVHVDTHNEDEIYQCELCPRMFRTKRARATHRLVDHMTEEEKLQQELGVVTLSKVFYQAFTCDPYKRPWAVKYVEKKWWSEALRSIFDARIKQKDSPATYVMLISTRVLSRIMYFLILLLLIPEIKNQSQPQVSHQNQARGKVLAVWYLRRKIVNSPELHQKS